MSPRLASTVLLALAAASSVARADEATPVPVPVSPGAFDHVLAARSCPTFSWGSDGRQDAPPSQHQIELAAERPSPDGRTHWEPLYRVEVPGRARSWTPAADRCAPPGGAYSWRMRSRFGDGRYGDDWGPWSEGSSFSVDPLATAASIRHLLETSGSTGGATETLPGTRPSSDRDTPADSTTEATLVAAPTLTIDGVLTVGELRSLNDSASFGAIETTTGISIALGSLRARTLRLNTDTAGTVGVQLQTNSQFLLLDTPGGSIVGDAKLIVDELGADDLIVGLPITTGRSGWFPPGLDGGGSGFAEVDADNVKLDTSGESCGTAPVQGVRLRIVDGDQIGVQLQCGAVPGQ